MQLLTSDTQPFKHLVFTNYNRVPLGFVCGKSNSFTPNLWNSLYLALQSNNTLLYVEQKGYPVGIGGELYGGSMFIKSAASYTDQGKAIQSINEKWGGESSGKSSGTRRPWEGRETIGIQVCKKKYTPFIFTIETEEDDENDAKKSNGTAASTRGQSKRFVKVVRMYGCPHHSNIRREKIQCHGVRKGWEPFGQWSLRKAEQLAKRETIRLNNGDDNSINRKDDSGDNKVAALCIEGKCSKKDESDSDGVDDIRTICHNGKCLWKRRGKYDDVYCELTGYSESSGEED